MSQANVTGAATRSASVGRQDRAAIRTSPRKHTMILNFMQVLKLNRRDDVVATAKMPLSSAHNMHPPSVA